MSGKKLSQKKFGSKRYVVQKIFGSKEVWPTDIKAPQKLGPQSLVEICSVTAELLHKLNIEFSNSSHFEYDNPYKQYINLAFRGGLQVLKGTRAALDYLTAELFLIWTNVAWTNVAWTNVAWTNVAWTNVTLTVGICSKCSQEPTFKVSSKSGQ